MLIKTESDTWKTKIKIFSSNSESTFLYLYADIMEKAQLSFFKSILNFSINAPDNLLKLEIEQTQIKNLPKTVKLVAKVIKVGLSRNKKDLLHALVKVSC